MPDRLFDYADELGPSRIIHVYEPSCGLEAILVIDNVASGPSIGGVRMAPDVSVDECFRLARAMTLKNAAAGLPHGGGKSVIFGDPKAPAVEKERQVRAFAHAIRNETDYIPGPDMGTDETAMAWVKDEIGRSVGLPPELGGIPLDEIGATGFGLLAATEVGLEKIGLRLEGARVVVQGFGSVGKHAARFLTERGALLVGASDSTGAVARESGLDVERLIALKCAGKGLAESGEGELLDRDAVIDIACDVWIPAARPDVIRSDNVDRLQARLVVQGANIPVTDEAEAVLHGRDIVSIPDFIANAGGVICAAVEFRGGTQAAAFQMIEEKVGANSEAVLTRSRADGVAPRQAALELARARVLKAMSLRRWS